RPTAVHSSSASTSTGWSRTGRDGSRLGRHIVVASARRCGGGLVAVSRLGRARQDRTAIQGPLADANAVREEDAVTVHFALPAEQLNSHAGCESLRDGIGRRSHAHANLAPIAQRDRGDRDPAGSSTGYRKLHDTDV